MALAFSSGISMAPKRAWSAQPRLAPTVQLLASRLPGNQLS
jgi:hypothetical protein